MRLHELFLRCSWKQNWIPQKDWLVYLAALETYARKYTDQSQANL